MRDQHASLGNLPAGLQGQLLQNVAIGQPMEPVAGQAFRGSTLCSLSVLEVYFAEP